MNNKKIVVCDDDEGILDMLTFVLEDSGYNVVPESNSLNLLSLIQREKPDLLLVDLWMPVLSGDQVVKQLRANPAMRSLLIVIISASTDGQKIAMEAGADMYIPKPFDIDQLTDKIAGILQQHENVR
jgi:DNA-binding response OmpR family regulator